MGKKKPTFRDFVLVMPATRGPEMHHFARNPNVGWSWVGHEGKVHDGFKRLRDAKADVERVHGKTDWRPDIGATWRGDYGPHFGPDEWLARSQSRL
jgi:hypothetical protein